MKTRPVFLWVVVAVLVTDCFGAINAFAWPVPDTGQTKCYDNEQEIPCPSEGEAFYGQDACYNINPMSYTKLDATGNDLPDDAASWSMVRDNVTSLIWEVKQAKDEKPDYSNPHDADNTYTWYDSNPETNGGNVGTPGDGADIEDFITALNITKYGGYQDWRIPAIDELASIVDYNIFSPNPAINMYYFINTSASGYWSSTDSALDENFSWVLDFINGSIYDTFKSKSQYVLAVRGKKADLLDNLIINGDGSVTDKNTGLMWQQNSPDPMIWQKCLSASETSLLALYNDWRLPTIKEILTIVYFDSINPAINVAFFPNTISVDGYWSSTTYASSADRSWDVSFGYGTGGATNKNYSEYFRFVRSGQDGSLGHPVILSPRQASSWETGSILPIRWQTAELGTNVKISLSRQGGKDGTFETIISSTANDGQEDWTITGAGSVNCVIKIEQADNTANWATEGLFVIKKRSVNPAMYLLLLE